MQACPAGQVPQLSPQPSSPHFFVPQLGVHAVVHLPSTQYFGQEPHELPQPLSPHSLPVHDPTHVGSHSLPSAEQKASPQQAPHRPPQPSEPQALSRQSGVQIGPPSPASIPPPSDFGTTGSASSPDEAQPLVKSRRTKPTSTRSTG